MRRERLEKIWTEIRLRHTLLASTVEYESFEDVRCVYKPYTNFKSARLEAAENLSTRYNTSKDAVLNEYLNGSRTLNDDKLAALIISSPEPEVDISTLSLQEGQAEQLQRYDFFILATHFLGDGMALHSTANEFFDLLGGKLEEYEKANSGLQWNTENGEIVRLKLVGFDIPDVLYSRFHLYLVYLQLKKAESPHQSRMVALHGPQLESNFSATKLK